MKWAVIGSGPTGHTVNIDDLAGQQVIAVDSAVDFAPRWDYYLQAGTERINSKGERSVRRTGKVRLWVKGPHVLEVLDARRQRDWPNPPTEWVKGTYLPWSDPIGPAAISYAVNHGADEVDVWGFEGDPSWPRRTKRMNTARLRAIIAGAGIPIVLHGDLIYSMSGKP